MAAICPIKTWKETLIFFFRYFHWFLLFGGVCFSPFLFSFESELQLGLTLFFLFVFSKVPFFMVAEKRLFDEVHLFQALKETSWQVHRLLVAFVITSLVSDLPPWPSSFRV